MTRMKHLCSALALSATALTTSHAALAAYWNFEEGSGTTTTDSVSNTASDPFEPGVAFSANTAAPTSTSSTSFDGTGRFGVNLNADAVGISGTGAKTIVAWINTTESDKRYFWGWSPTNGLQPGQDLRFGIELDGKLRFEISSGFVRYDDLSLNDGNWHMVAAIINAGDTAGDIDFYIDGDIVTPTGGNTTLVNTAGTGTGDSATPNEMFFGSSGNTNTQYWNGGIDDFAIYDTALTDAQLDDIRLNGITVPEPSSAALLGLGGISLILRRRK
ncbi:LamG-like jellyroll fold domain-containing protein [Sulfuriroseicoccus oceanibius]|uniref:PEP-CTERM sorting domain-containing protein n=1 Tax=Sulfuriroseicoccus oceanibius TaxID=2707525 RepID=A0A7T7F4E0_9BACT|nr:LamG-like jellyroll fold domain-containing protein [Sulfuriroseicoccus oceanibius]QQL46429.1 PEP-CTERM sorting domain-containing protein [Sulfuriroseicoccus oceanibius]